ncbi:MAG: DUF1501 domain-containing protein [Planctomycetota bacterium]|nr:DUF1501 domain-containing protein [Planctomycetota bacterium]MDA1177675.1 DUF1501 domain-containing protein [Planctomycetota bacterium]
MLSILGRPRHTCNGISRRELLTAGGAGLFGLSLPQLMRAEAESPSQSPGRAKSVIFLFLFGGPSQLETFDMKPDAPSEIRGPFSPIRCRTPGLHISEHLPRLADLSDKYCIVRTMSHSYNDHSGGAHYIQTGRRWHIPIGGGFNATPADAPSIGSVVELTNQESARPRLLPSYAVLPNWLGRLEQSGQYRRPGQYAGWLGQAYNPMTTSVDKRDAADNPYWRDCSDAELTYALDGMSGGVTLDVLNRRASLLDQFELSRRQLDSVATNVFTEYREKALHLVTSHETRNALDIQAESPAMRDRYGRHLLGQSCLMARRLVESGVRFVTVHYETVDGYGWDSHLNSEDVKHHLLPTFDQACSALLTDLEERGLLDETLVVAMGEMGRTPVATNQWGRGHWSTLFPALLAGAGIRGGSTYGRSDKKAAYPIESPVSPEDMAATLFWALGIDEKTVLYNAEGRPTQLHDGGTALTELFS